MTTSRLIRAPLWATLVAASLAAIGVTLFVFVQSGQAAPAADDQASATKAAKASYQIVGGKPVPDGKYPFMVAIFDKKKPPNPNNPYRMICAGTLIDENSVLTAGHCLLAWPNYKKFYSPQRLLVTVGPTVLTSSQGQVRSVKRFSVHPDFKEFEDPNDPYWLQDKYDAGVIELSRPVSGIAPIKLATSKQNYLERPGRNATVAGWGLQLAYQPGADFPPESVVQERMREAQVPIVSDSRAKQIYTDYIPPILIAAGGKGKDACLGDSGGPMFAGNGSSGGKYTQIGITSYGAGCGAKGVPGVYTEVNNPSIRSFITSEASN